MKITVVGCWGGYPALGEATSSYLIEQDGFTLLVDAGSGSLAQLQKYQNIMAIDAVILSHYHHDHVADIGVIQYAWLTQSYMNHTTDILPIYGHAEDAEEFAKLTHKYTEGIAYDPNMTITVGPFMISFFKTNHPVPCFGMRIASDSMTVVYTADTSYDDCWIPFSRQADLLITDCNFYQGQEGSQAGHMTSQEGAWIAKEARVNQLLLSHLPQYGDRSKLVEEARAVFSGRIDLAHSGWTLEK